MSRSFKKISPASTRKMPIGEKATENGITYERLSGGDGRWTVGFMVDGSRIHRVIGLESEGVTLTQVEKFIEETRTKARAGRLNLPKGRKLTLAFSQAADDYLKRLRESDGKGIDFKDTALRLHLKPFFGDIPVTKLCQYDLERYHKFRQDENAKPATINRELTVFSHILSKAEEWKWIDYRPVKVKRLKVEESRLIYLTAVQADNLVQAATHDQNPHIYPFIVIGLETGMRKMEILRMKRTDVDTVKRLIFIPKAKVGMREQPITSGLASYLKRYMESLHDNSEWLFPCSTSKTGHTVAIEKAFRRVVADAGLASDVCRHTLRHTAITHLVQSGVDLPTVARISGHRTLSMVAKYAHANGEHIQAATDKLENRYQHT
ncbi:MAG: site-specific integrase [Desulfuromonadales bacterium]|nr:site-specific integrase [Desulfuromonadales bacterium]